MWVAVAVGPEAPRAGSEPREQPLKTATRAGPAGHTRATPHRDSDAPERASGLTWRRARLREALGEAPCAQPGMAPGKSIPRGCWVLCSYLTLQQSRALPWMADLSPLPARRTSSCSRDHGETVCRLCRFRSPAACLTGLEDEERFLLLSISRPWWFVSSSRSALCAKPGEAGQAGSCWRKEAGVRFQQEAALRESLSRCCAETRCLVVARMLCVCVCVCVCTCSENQESFQVTFLTWDL